MTKNDLLSMFHIDDDAKQAFLKMDRNEQQLAVLGMLAHLRNESAKMMKRIIDLEQDFNRAQDQQRTYRLMREQEDKRTSSIIMNWMANNNITTENLPTLKLSEDELLNTTQKVTRMITRFFHERDEQTTKKLTPWRNMFFGILQTVLTIIVLALLYISFGGQVPGR